MRALPGLSKVDVREEIDHLLPKVLEKAMANK